MPQSTIGTVYLKVANLYRLVTFYEEIIGMQIHRRDDKTVFLGAGGPDLLALTESPESRRVPGSTGLYHFAILVPSRLALARSLKHLMDSNTQLQGASDHLVSEALYLADPEGNGIEIYRDRVNDDWFEDGQLRMGTEAMDVRGVLGTLDGHEAEWEGLPEETVIGHIHLHVSEIAPTEAFYRDLLGLDVMMNLGYAGATFMSYKRYHHHVGANTWAGRVPPPPDTLGLDKYDLYPPDAHSLDAILTRLDEAGVPVTEAGQDHIIQDPSQNRVVLKVRSSVAN